MQRRIVGFAVITSGLFVVLLACARIAPGAENQIGRVPVQPGAVFEVTYYVRVTETRAVFPAHTDAATREALAARPHTNSPPATLAATPTQPIPAPSPTPEVVAPDATATSPNTAMPATPSYGSIDGSINGLRIETLALHNAARANQGLPPFVLNTQLQQAAQMQADWLSQKPKEDLWSIGAGAHIGAGGTGYVERIFAVGYSTLRQNVNENFMMAASPQDAMDWWLSDPNGAPTHRPQILSGLYREVGIGIVKHSSGAGYVFIITFGRQ